MPTPPKWKPPAAFWRWALWRRRGGKPADRPSGLPPSIPALWWAEYKRRGFKPIKPTPPVPPAAMGTFGEKGLWLAWPFDSMGWTPAVVAQLAASVGAKWVTLDAGNSANLTYFAATAQACAARGIKAGLWCQLHSAQVAASRCQQVSAPFYIAQNEGMGQTEPGFPSLFRQAAPGVELALVASPWDGLPDPRIDPIGWETYTKPWVDAGVVVIAEAYLGSNPSGGQPAQQAAEAAFRGFKRRAVVLEA